MRHTNGVAPGRASAASVGLSDNSVEMNLSCSGMGMLATAGSAAVQNLSPATPATETFLEMPDVILGA